MGWPLGDLASANVLEQRFRNTKGRVLDQLKGPTLREVDIPKPQTDNTHENSITRCILIFVFFEGVRGGTSSRVFPHRDFE